MEWDYYFVDMLEHIAIKSRDISTKVGSILVNKENSILSTGFNGFPRGIKDSKERLENRAIKLSLTCHSEANCIYNCARNGIATKGCTLYVSYPCCHECAKVIIQAGIIRVVVDKKKLTPEFLKRWENDIAIGKMLMEEAGIIYEEF